MTGKSKGRGNKIYVRKNKEKEGGDNTVFIGRREGHEDRGIRITRKRT